MNETKSRILDLAEELIRSQGYHAISYKDIATPLGIKNAAIHYHFPTKEELGLAIINRTRADLLTKTILWKDDDPLKKLKSFINIYEQSRERNLICFMGALGSSYDALPESMKKQLTLASEEIVFWLSRTLEEGKQKGAFNFPENAQTKANLIISSLLSSLILNKVMAEDILQSVSKSIIKHI